MGFQWVFMEKTHPWNRDSLGKYGTDCPRIGGLGENRNIVAARAMKKRKEHLAIKTMVKMGKYGGGVLGKCNECVI